MKNRAQPNTEMLSTRHDLPLSVDLNINSTDIGNKWSELKLYPSLSSQPAVSIDEKSVSWSRVLRPFVLPNLKFYNNNIVVLEFFSRWTGAGRPVGVVFRNGTRH